MANYNTFIIYDCKRRKNVLVTSSARKAKEAIHTGFKIEVWNDNTLIEVIYANAICSINKYISLEKQYITNKQAKAELRNKNKRRKSHGL